MGGREDAEDAEELEDVEDESEGVRDIENSR